MNTKVKILILAANPVNTSQLRLDKEVRSIVKVLKQSDYYDRFQLINEGAVKPGHLSKAILEYKPEIVHFSGHGQGTPTGKGDRSPVDHSRDVGLESDPSPLVHEGLMLEDDQGRAKLVSTSALAGLFELFQNEVRCVVLNACYSETQAAAIHQHVDCVVGMNNAISDRAAIKFATEFYRALSRGKAFKFAYDFARNGLDLDSSPESLTPVLLNRSETEDPFHLTTALLDIENDWLSDGKTIELQIQHSQKWLDGRTGDGTVGLADSTKGIFTGTQWKVHVVNRDDRIIRLETLGDHLTGLKWLDGRTGDGTVGLVDSTKGNFTGIRWRVHFVNRDNRIIRLETLGHHLTGLKWLDGRTGDGTVGLANSTEGNFTGTQWKVSIL